jgi:hypothetical protein
MEPTPKPWYTSKLIWVNLITAAISMLAALQGAELIKEFPHSVAVVGFIIAFLNIILRLITNQPVTLRTPPAPLVLPVLLCVILGADTCWAQRAKATLTGPKEVISGDIIKIDGSQSEGTSFAWKLVNPDRPDRAFFPGERNTYILFSAGVLQERVFTFCFVAAGVNPNGGAESDIAFHDLLVKPLYAPAPVTPVTPVTPPVTPVNPPQPPAGKVTGVVLLWETADSTQQQQALLLALRGDERISKVVTALDKDAENRPLVDKLTKFLGGKPLPRLIALGESGPVFSVEVPSNLEDLRTLLQTWGL